ncbi:MAG: hypothetical protein KDK71_10195, partial [Chlamydiia bacterium]|nr:hypothetical protein [Chlamydiia bacterium]
MLELPKRFHPDFSRPKVKPSGLVEIDWSNPLTRGLTKLTLVDVPFELVNNKNITLVGTQLISADRSGKYRNFGGGNNLYVSTGAPHNGSMTLFAVAKPTSFPINGNLIGCDSDSSGLRSFQFRVTTGAKLEFIPFVANVPKFITGTTSLSASTTYSLAATYDQNLTANTAKVFIDGKQDAALNITGACDTDAAALAIAARLRLSNGTTPTEWFNGNIYFAACWDRPLTAEEIKSLADDPYQILKPANDLYYFPAVGVGGSTVEAAALYSNISSMLSGKIGTLNASVDISSGYTDVDAGDVNYNVFSNFNTVTNYSSPSGSIVEVSTTFSTSSDMGNAPVSDVISLVDFNTI